MSEPNISTGMPTPKEMDAYKRGEEAFGRGAEIDDNPYWDNLRLRDFWDFGWHSAQNKTPDNLRTTK